MHRSVILLVLLCSTIAANAQTTFPPTNPNLNEAPLYPDAMMADDEFQNPVMFSFDGGHLHVPLLLSAYGFTTYKGT